MVANGNFWSEARNLELQVAPESDDFETVGYLKITKDKVLDAYLTKCKGHSQLRHESQIKRENEISTQTWMSS